MSRSARCEASGCVYKASGYPPCTQGCVDSGRPTSSPHPCMVIPGMAAAMAAAHGLPMAAHLIHSEDSASGTEDQRTSLDFTGVPYTEQVLFERNTRYETSWTCGTGNHVCNPGPDHPDDTGLPRADPHPYDASWQSRR